MEERYRGSHRDGKIKREIGRGERKRDRSGREREREREPQNNRGMVGERKIGRETWVERETATEREKERHG